MFVRTKRTFDLQLQIRKFDFPQYMLGRFVCLKLRLGRVGNPHTVTDFTDNSPCRLLRTVPNKELWVTLCKTPPKNNMHCVPRFDVKEHSVTS